MCTRQLYRGLAARRRMECHLQGRKEKKEREMKKKKRKEEKRKKKRKEGKQ